MQGNSLLQHFAFGLNAMGVGFSRPVFERLTGKTFGRINRVTNAAKKIGSSLFMRRKKPVVIRNPKTQNTAPSISLMPMNIVSQMTKAQVNTTFSQPKSNLSFGVSPPALITSASWVCVSAMFVALHSIASDVVVGFVHQITSPLSSTQPISFLSQQSKRFHETLKQKWAQNPVRAKLEVGNLASTKRGNALKPMGRV
jgi:hypothetical protein